MDLTGKEVTVLGLGQRTGPAVIDFLQKKEASVFASESSSHSPVLDQFPRLPAELGGHTSRVYQDKDLIIVSPGVPADIPIIREAKKRGIPVWSEIELASRFLSSRIIAITGTNGKSTVASLLGKYLQHLDSRVVVAGNIGVPLISRVEEMQKSDLVVVEVSSFQLELIESLQPEIAVILNIAPDHLNRHQDMETYFSLKKKIFSRQKEKDLLILNYDDHRLRSIARDPIIPRTAWFSLAERVEGFFVEGDCLYSSLQEKVLFKTGAVKVPGRHNLANVLVAAGIAGLLGVNPEDLARETASFSGLPHTMEYLGRIDGIRFINDSKGTNPQATASVLQGLPGPKVLMAGGQDRGLDLEDLARAIAREEVRALIITGENKRALIRAVEETGFSNFSSSASLEEAFYRAWDQARPGDCIIFSPGAASWDRFKDYRERGEQFRALFRELKRRREHGTKGN